MSVKSTIKKVAKALTPKKKAAAPKAVAASKASSES